MASKPSKRLRDALGIDPDRIVSAALEAALGEIEQPRKKRHPGRVLAAGAALAAAATVGQRRMPKMAKVPLRMGLNKLGDMTHVDELADALHDRADALRDRLTGHDDEFDDADVADDEEFDEEGDDELPDDVADDDFDDEDLDDDEGFDDGPEDDDGPLDEGDGDEPESEDDEDLEDEPEDEVADDEELEDEELEDEEPEDEDAEEDLPEDEELEEDDDEEVAARSLDLGISSGRDRVPELFEALSISSRRAPVMRRGSRPVDPALRPPEPGAGRHPVERRDTPRKSKPKTARA